MRRSTAWRLGAIALFCAACSDSTTPRLDVSAADLGHGDVARADAPPAGDTGRGDGPQADTLRADGAHPPGDLAPPPPAVCAVPAAPVDVSKPTTVVGSGSAASCTPQALAAAVAAGGVITFNCGAAPVTITVNAELAVTKGTTIDGGGTITLDGGGTTRIIHLKSAWNVATPLLTVQNLAFHGGYTTDVPNTTSTKQGGAAIFEDGGSLTVINCSFTDNHCASTGQDVSGGAINGQGIGTLIIVGSTFSGNSGSNGGAVGTQAENVTVVNSTFTGNKATGSGGNPGNGGDGGALTYDGANNSLTLCGDTFISNQANAAGGAVFRVGYNNEPVNIDRCVFEGNSVDTASGNAAGLYLEHVTINMTATTISGNTGHFGGGLWAGQSSIVKLTNVTIANNSTAAGGAIWFANQVTGTLLNCTIVGNTGGLFGGDTGVSLHNTIVANNPKGTLDSTTNCAKAHGSSGPNLQYPGSGTLCTTGITIGDPKLGPLQDNGGTTRTMLPGAGSPAIGAGTGCPATDQRGKPRAGACTLGAVEVP
jgi:hypothetical protein